VSRKAHYSAFQRWLLRQLSEERPQRTEQ